MIRKRTPQSCSLWVRRRDRRVLAFLAARNLRTMADELTMILAEACRDAGFDPTTLTPLGKRPRGRPRKDATPPVVVEVVNPDPPPHTDHQIDL